MENTEIVVRKITPQKGFLLTNGEIVTNAVFAKDLSAFEEWWEIPDPDYVPEEE